MCIACVPAMLNRLALGHAVGCRGKGPSTYPHAGAFLPIPSFLLDYQTDMPADMTDTSFFVKSLNYVYCVF